MAGGTNAFSSDAILADTRRVDSAEITIVTAGTIVSIAIPDNVIGFKLFPRTNTVRFDVNNTSVSAVAALAVTGGTAQIDISTSFSRGGIAKNDQWETRLLERKPDKVLSMRCATASTVVDVEFFR